MRSRIFLFAFVLLFLLIFVAAVQSQTAPASTTATVLEPAQLDEPRPDATVAQLEYRGDQLRFAKDFPQALVFYRAALAKEPKNAVLYNKAGITEIQMNDLRAAKKDVERSLKYDPRYPDARNNLGVIYYLRRDYRKAIGHYEKALLLREDSAPFHSNLGTAWFARKEFDKAMKEYARAVQIDPDVLTRSSIGGVAAHLASPADRARYSYMLAKMYAQRGDVERCLHCLRLAKEANYSKLHEVHSDADFATVRTDPRFNELQIPLPQ